MCGEESEEQFDSCWKCATPLESDSIDLEFQERKEVELAEGSLLVLTRTERRAMLGAVCTAGVPLVFCWMFPRSAISSGALLLALPVILILRVRQAKDARWPFTWAAVPYALYLFWMALSMALLSFGGMWTR
jgi:hypothetical protein